MTAPATPGLWVRQRATALRPYLGLFLVLAIAGALYLPMAFVWFQTDDFLFMKAFQDSSIAGYIKGAFDIRHAPPAPEIRFYRPLHSTAFLFLYQVFGLQAAGYHAWSLLVHLFNTCMIWVLAMRLTRRPLVAGLAAAFFALHPAYTPAIAWISNNNALMATAAALVSFYCFIRAQDSGRNVSWYAASVVSYGASLLFHPEAGTMIVVLFAYRMLYGAGGVREALRWRHWMQLLPFGLIALGYLSIHQWMLSRDYLPQAEGARIEVHMLRSYASYMAMSAWPSATMEPVLRSAHQLIGLAVMLGTIGVLLYCAVARGQRAAALAVLWFLAALVPLSTGLGLLGLTTTGRKLYVAGPGLALVLALFVAPAVETLATSTRQLARVALLAACVVVLALAGWRVVKYEDQVAVGATQSHAFITELRKTYPDIPPGTRLYVTRAPISLTIFGYQPYLQGIIGLYYKDVEVILDFDGTLPPLQPGDLVFPSTSPTGPSPPWRQE